jgi:hypothetical protein
MRRPPINLSPGERLARIVAGAAGAVAGTLLLLSAGGPAVVVIEVALLLAGLDLVVTGALGFCPLYHRLGRVPRGARRSA